MSNSQISMIDLRRELKLAEEDLKKAMLIDPKFQAALVGLRKLKHSYGRAIRGLRLMRATLTVARLLSKPKKLPRKAKKRFIRQHGREAYHNQFTRQA